MLGKNAKKVYVQFCAVTMELTRLVYVTVKEDGKVWNAVCKNRTAKSQSVMAMDSAWKAFASVQWATKENFVNKWIVLTLVALSMECVRKVSASADLDGGDRTAVCSMIVSSAAFPTAPVMEPSTWKLVVVFATSTGQGPTAPKLCVEPTAVLSGSAWAANVSARTAGRGPSATSGSATPGASCTANATMERACACKAGTEGIVRWRVVLVTVTIMANVWCKMESTIVPVIVAGMVPTAAFDLRTYVMMELTMTMMD